jgi:hypothetical protein
MRSSQARLGTRKMRTSDGGKIYPLAAPSNSDNRGPMKHNSVVTAVLMLGLVGCIVTDSRPTPVSQEPLGGPCVTNSDCTRGLSCSAFIPVTGFVGAEEAANLCTQSCSDGGCPVGSTCVANMPDAGQFCVPTCTTDADCQIGGRAQVCEGYPVDGGPTVCEFLICGLGGDSSCHDPNVPCMNSQCPSGFACVRQPDEPQAWCQKS